MAVVEDQKKEKNLSPPVHLKTLNYRSIWEYTNTYLLYIYMLANIITFPKR